MERYGGEFKLNLARGGLAPFLTGGAGIVRFSPEGRESSRNIYLTGGGGIQLTGADRYALTIQADALTYRFNPASTLLTNEDLLSVGLGYGDFQQTTVVNPAFRAALNVYLGGRRPGELSEVDRAYLAQFNSGLSGLSLQVEPTFGRINFDGEAPFRDQSSWAADRGGPRLARRPPRLLRQRRRDR